MDKCLALRHIKPWSPHTSAHLPTTASLGRRPSYKLSLETLESQKRHSRASQGKESKYRTHLSSSYNRVGEEVGFLL